MSKFEIDYDEIFYSTYDGEYRIIEEIDNQRVYSKDTCCFILMQDNVRLAACKTLPIIPLQNYNKVEMCKIITDK